MTSADMLAAREALVLRHVDAENAHDLDAVLATFAHPRYEIVPTGVVHDGEAAVSRMLLLRPPADGRAPWPGPAVTCTTER